MTKDFFPPFREEVQGFRWMFTLLILGLVLITLYSVVHTGESDVLAVVAVMIALIPLLFGRMVTDIDSHNVVIRFGYPRWLEKKIPLSDIVHVEVVTYRPLRQFGGWGIRFGQFRGERTVCYSMGGSTGVLVALSRPLKVFFVGTRKVIIGSTTPGRLAEAITQVRSIARRTAVPQA